MINHDKVVEIIGYIYPIIKTMKTSVYDIILVHDNVLAMISDDSSKLSSIDLPGSTGISICCRFNDIILASEGEGKSKKTWVDEVYYNYDMPMYYDSLNIYNKYVTGCNECILSVENFQESYPEACSVPSKGYMMYRVEDIVLTMISGIFKLNKGDTVSLDVYKGIYPDTYIVRYDVYKKKLKNTISIYVSQFIMR